MRYNIVSKEGERTSVTVFIGAETLVATRDHLKFNEICDYLTSGRALLDPESLRELFNVTIPVGKKFAALSERVTINNGQIFFDLTPVDNAITQAILRFQADSLDFQPLVNFMEKIESNPNPHSREHLFRWLRDRQFSIADDGDFIAYKSVNNGRSGLRSVTAGKAVVNGELVNSYVPNEVGTVIEMPRDEVTFNPSNGCSVGLHAGTWDYARSFGGNTILQVKINPRDVVSVPTDCSDAKLRVCRYRVVQIVNTEDTSNLLLLGYLNTAKVVVQPKQDSEQDAPLFQPVVNIEFPDYYEQFNKKHFEACGVRELSWLCKEWEISPIPKTKKELVNVLNKTAQRIRRQLTS